MKTDQIKTFLRRTLKLRKQWSTVSPRKVDLNVVSYNKNPFVNCDRLEGMKECGSVGCLAGWAYALNKAQIKKAIPHPPFSSRLNVTNKYYGQDRIPFFALTRATLFGARHTSGISQWREACQRLDERIIQLRHLIQQKGK